MHLTYDEVVAAAVERPFDNNADGVAVVRRLENFADDLDGSRAKIADKHDGTIVGKVDGSSLLELRAFNEFVQM